MRAFLLILLLTAAAVATPVELSYAGVVRLALERNLALVSRTLDGARAQARLEEAIALRNPTLGVWGIYENKSPNVIRGFLPDSRFVAVAEEQGFHPDALFVDSQNTILVRPSLYVPIYTGGRLESAIHVQQAFAPSRGERERRARQQVALAARTQYLDTLLAEENVGVAELVQAQAREAARLARSRQRAGVANRCDVMQALVAESQAATALTLTTGSLAKANTDLAALLNLPALTSFHLQDGFASLDGAGSQATPSLASLVTVALQQRPEFAELRARLQAEQERVNQAQAGLLPQLSANLNYDIAGATVDPRAGFSLLASLGLPIFDGGLSRAQMEEYRLRGLRLEWREMQQVETALREVNAARLELLEASQRLTAAQAAETAARESVRLASKRFEVGAGTSLELTVAQTSLGNAQFGLAQARYRQLQCRAKLDYAIGTDE